MLKQRVITAIIMALVFIGVLFFLPWQGFSIFIGAVLIVGAWEWANLAGLQSRLSRGLYMAGITVAAIAAGVLSEWSTDLNVLKPIFVIATGWWALSLLWIQSYPSSSVIWGSTIVRAGMGFFVLVPAWLACVHLRVQSEGAWLMLLVVLLVAAADIGAYFSGRALGKRKLAPRVSPGKSWEGVFGGAVLALLVSVGFNLSFGGGAWVALFVIAVPAAMISVVGDLLESMVKRHRGVKDSSQLLPGHGGVLDRIDGLVAAAPVFTLIFILSEWRI